MTLSFIHASENQEKIQEEKQKKAQEKRDEAQVLKEIENAQKEIDKLDKYVNKQGSLSKGIQNCSIWKRSFIHMAVMQLG